MSQFRHSLRELDIVIPYREASDERRENLYAVLAHLALTYSDYRIWLIEADETPKFEWSRAGDSHIRHVFVPHRGAFPKAALCNIGAKLATSPVICFHDADSIGNPMQMMSCVASMLDGDESEVLCPYSKVVNVTGALKQSFVQLPRFDWFAQLLDPANLPPDAQLLYLGANGGIVFFRRDAYARVGGYNAQLEGWGGEDDELFSRATRLGLRWHSFLVPLIHLHHDVSSREPAIAATRGSKNVMAAEAARTMPLVELEEMATRLSENFRAPTFQARTK
ncbi:glycosyltransferase involved in cell wall biosynthesis [Variovorax sp. GrIS 2.14]|uniref:galactosyltransferase-related protein n=1 Tax=Variovorax sp. GrIS 2.14 TaxID=3071709 RepID=UPI0038F7CF45